MFCPDLFYRGRMPVEEELLNKEDTVRLKRCLYALQRDDLPPVTTHNVVNDWCDPVLNTIRRCKLFNTTSDKVKVSWWYRYLLDDWCNTYTAFRMPICLGIYYSCVPIWIPIKFVESTVFFNNFNKKVYRATQKNCLLSKKQMYRYIKINIANIFTYLNKLTKNRRTIFAGGKYLFCIKNICYLVFNKDRNHPLQKQ